MRVGDVDAGGGECAEGFTLTEGLSSSLGAGGLDTFTCGRPWGGYEEWDDISFSTNDSDESPIQLQDYGDGERCGAAGSERPDERSDVDVGGEHGERDDQCERDVPGPGTDVGDVDMWRFTVMAGQRVGFDIDRASGKSGLLHPVVYGRWEQNWRPTTIGLGRAGEAASSESYLEYTFVQAGTYYLGVSG